MTPRVSIVMPVRDTEPYVAEAVASILDQTLRDLELVVIDDGSTDATAEIVRAFAATDGRVRLSAGRGNGLVAALNAGCALASAPLLARMDGDDVAEPMRIAKQVEVMDAEPELVLLGTAVTQIDEGGARFGTVVYPEAPGDELLRRNCFAHPTVVFRRDAFEQADGYRDLFPYAEDYDLWLRLAELGRVANLSEPLLRYRLHGNQVTRQQIEEQAASTLGAQAMAQMRQARGHEVARAELVIDEVVRRRRVLDAHLDLAGSRLDSGRAEDAAMLLAQAREVVRGAPVTLRLNVLIRSMRLAVRRPSIMWARLGGVRLVGRTDRSKMNHSDRP